MASFDELTARHGVDPIHSCELSTLQANVGLRCNMCCAHCHVAAGPHRTEEMDGATMDAVVELASGLPWQLVDITGGAPELHPRIRPFIERLRAAGRAVQLRTNLTALLEPGNEDLPRFMREHKVGLVGSLPCYLEENVRSQRGAEAYERSIEAVRRLNREGYGLEEGLPLALVYNPAGAALPPGQSGLEADYKRELASRFDIHFTRLLTITNAPIGRFLEALRKKDRAGAYLEQLREAFNPETVEGLMCRHQLSVGWDGTLYDCDFNLALGLPVNHGAPSHIRDFDPDATRRRRVVTGDHCLACTAGAGSSCGGALKT